MIETKSMACSLKKANQVKIHSFFFFFIVVCVLKKTKENNSCFFLLVCLLETYYQIERHGCLSSRLHENAACWRFLT